MNYSNYRFTLDVQSNLSQVSLPVKLNDSGRRLLIGLTDGGNPYQISKGSLAKFTFKRSEPNSEGVYESGLYDCVLEDNNSTIRFDLTRAVTGVAGVVDCEIRLYGPNGRLITSPRFIIVVDDRVIYDDDIPLTDEQASTIDAIILSEAKRVEAENKRVKAEAAREETLREAIVSIDQSIQEITPSIGDNGNWFIGEEDTGTPATGNDVVTVTVTGNETDGYTADKTFAEIVAAEKEGKIVQVYHYGCVLQLSYKPTASTRVYSSFITNGGFITITLRTRGTGPIDGVFVRRVEFDTNGKPAWTLRSAGTVVVPADEWNDENPSSAYIGIEGMEAGDLILLSPADTSTAMWCEDLHVHVSTMIVDSVNDRTLLFRCGLGDTYAGGDLTFDYRVLTCSEPLTQCVAVLAGVEYSYCDMIARVQKSLTHLEEEQKDAVEDLGELKGVLWGTDDVGKSVREVSDVVAAAHNVSEEAHADIRESIADLLGKVSQIPKFSIEAVTELPDAAEASLTTVYLVVSGDNEPDVYVEWICTEKDGVRAWERLGTQTVDLVGYSTTEETERMVGDKIAHAVETTVFEQTANQVEAYHESPTFMEMMLNLFHPVGDVVMNFSADWNPNTAWGGTWDRIEEKFLVGARADAKEGDSYYVGIVGGSETVTLAVENLPQHTHFIGDDNYKLIGAEGTSESATSRGIQYTTNGRGSTLRTNQSSECNSKPFSILPPYQAVYIWRRTA